MVEDGRLDRDSSLLYCVYVYGILWVVLQVIKGTIIIELTLQTASVVIYDFNRCRRRKQLLVFLYALSKLSFSAR